MKHLSWLIVVALVGCKSKAPEAGAGSAVASGSSVASGSDVGSGSAGSGSSGSGSATAGSGSGSAAAAADDGAELKRRDGKKTGLGAADEKPEVITEDLLRKIADGTVKLDRFLDPKRAIVYRVNMPGGSNKPTPGVDKKLCGADGPKEVAAYVKHMVERETKGKADELGSISCNNEFAAADDPTFGQNEYQEGKAVPMKQVSCVSTGAGEYDEVAYVVWLPDAQRGFRIAGIVSTEQGANTGAMWNVVATELAAGKPCP